MSRNYRRRNNGRGPIIHVHNNNTAQARAKSTSDSCLVAMGMILSSMGALVALCVAVPSFIPVLAGTGMAYTASMLKQQV